MSYSYKPRPTQVVAGFDIGTFDIAVFDEEAILWTLKPRPANASAARYGFGRFGQARYGQSQGFNPKPRTSSSYTNKPRPT